MTVIDSFSGEYAFLSNFYYADVSYWGVIYPTVEHAFQAAKTENMTAREFIRSSSSPGIAKRRGRRLQLREGWDQIRVDVMTLLIYDKFTRHLTLQDKLLVTGDARLVEGNTWGDEFWGVCRGYGQNHLGRVLMSTRERLRYESRR